MPLTATARPLPTPAAECRAAAPGRAQRLGGALAALADQSLVSGTSFLASVIVKRVCDDAGLGLYSLGLSLLILAANFHGSLVVSPYTFFAHHVPPRRRRDLDGSVLAQHAAMTLLLALLALAGAAAVALWTGGSAATLAGVLAICIPCFLLREFARRLLLVDLRTYAVLALDALVCSLQIAGLLLLAYGRALTPPLAHLVLSGLAGAAGLAWLLAARSRFRIVPRRLADDARQSWRFGRWVCIDQLLAVATAYLPHWVLALTLGSEATGQFATCLIVAQLANPLVFAMGNLLEPRAAAAVAGGGPAALRRVVQSTTWVTGGWMALLCTLFALGGRKFIELVYNSHFDSLQITVAILAGAALLLVPSISHQLGLRAAQHSGTNVVVGLVGLAATLLVAVAGARLWGVPGAALSLLAGNLITWLGRRAAFRALTRPPSAEAAP